MIITILIANFAQAEDYFAAIAFSKSAGRTTTANNEHTLEAAKWAALRSCAYDDCYVAAYVQNGCVAAAISHTSLNEKWPNIWYGFADHRLQATAESYAIEICEFNAQQYCNVYVSICTRPHDVWEPKADLAEVLKLTPEDSKEAQGILKLINIAAARYLRDTVGLSERVANKIGGMKVVLSITDLIAESQIGMRDFKLLLYFAKNNGYIK